MLSVSKVSRPAVGELLSRLYFLISRTRFYELLSKGWTPQYFCQDLNFSSFSFDWYCRFPSLYWMFISLLRSSLFKVRWYRRRKTLTFSRNIFNSSFHHGTVLLVFSFLPLDIRKAVLHAAVTHEKQSCIRSSMLYLFTFPSNSSSKFICVRLVSTVKCRDNVGS